MWQHVLWLRLHLTLVKVYILLVLSCARSNCVSDLAGHPVVCSHSHDSCQLLRTGTAAQKDWIRMIFKEFPCIPDFTAAKFTAGIDSPG